MGLYRVLLDLTGLSPTLTGKNPGGLSFLWAKFLFFIHFTEFHLVSMDSTWRLGLTHLDERKCQKVFL